VDRTLFPLIAVIRTHADPCLDTPEHIARQWPPATVALTETLVPFLMITRTRALVVWPDRRFVLHRAVFVDVAPRTSPGIDTELTTKKKRAPRTAATKSVVREARAA
jgi:hypothetical protein